jgi:hypothetical protein
MRIKSLVLLFALGNALVLSNKLEAASGYETINKSYAVTNPKPEPYITEKLNLPEFGTFGDRIAGSILASATGNAQGRATVLISKRAMFFIFPKGVTSLKDIADAEYSRKTMNDKAMTIYTHETQMATDV